jgi:hypothetical protein
MNSKGAVHLSADCPFFELFPEELVLDSGTGSWAAVVQPPPFVLMVSHFRDSPMHATASYGEHDVHSPTVRLT